LAQRTEIKNLTSSKEFLQMFLHHFADPEFKSFIKNDSLLLALGYKSVKYPGKQTASPNYPSLDLATTEIFLQNPGQPYKVKLHQKKNVLEYPVSPEYFSLGIDVWYRKTNDGFMCTKTADGFPDTLWRSSSLSTYSAYKFIFDDKKLIYIDQIFRNGSKEHCMTFRYDEDGLLFECFDTHFKRSFNYDANKKLVSIIHGYTSLITGTPYQTNYEYDEMGRLKKSFTSFAEHNFPKKEIVYGYNALGLIETLNGAKIIYNK
jgi:hypothetical protein